mmetsp:Transcript_17979/g.38661  ORF Transcript_17979/g.38661 Transcript_17979/m.38661 type:complete len:285 (+) Transcript_17979:118-972(+)
MLKQSAPLGLRLLQSSKEQGCGKLIWNAALFTSKATSEVAGEAQEVAAAFVPKVAQYSTSAAAQLAAKKQYLGGAGTQSLASTRAFGTFASKVVSVGAAAPAAVEATAQATGTKPSLLKRLAQAAAAVAGAVMLAVAAPASADAPHEWQWGFQDSATSTMQAQQDLHHDIMFFVISIVTLVLYMMFQIATKFHYTKQGPLAEKFTHHTTLEVLWTVIPTFVVLFITIPSLTLIYSLDQHTDRPGLTVKIIGRQWYWSYEMHDHLQHKLVDPDRLVAIAEKSLKA